MAWMADPDAVRSLMARLVAHNNAHGIAADAAPVVPARTSAPEPVAPPRKRVEEPRANPHSQVEVPSANPYMRWRPADLRAECIRRGISVPTGRGTKAYRAQQLLAFDERRARASESEETRSEDEQDEQHELDYTTCLMLIVAGLAVLCMVLVTRSRRRRRQRRYHAFVESVLEEAAAFQRQQALLAAEAPPRAMLPNDLEAETMRNPLPVSRRQPETEDREASRRTNEDTPLLLTHVPSRTESCIFRLLNVLFSDEFSKRFARTGDHISRADRARGRNPHGRFWNDVAVAYRLPRHDCQTLIKTHVMFDGIDVTYIVPHSSLTLQKIWERANDDYIAACASFQHDDAHDDDFVRYVAGKAPSLYLHYWLKARA
ncbi:hypothetical protein Poli38472_010063 [Pythium oligandrum]|uniref:Uncharacterized protein n=1 Tax=Pythium oligandrum TaxID=41045 RepID=A0A8K1C8N6_PYTOL|nr:hypothetical protein Poli38472_010063 [Pythium oligandrum]|eukprot:TMW58504.1 hypothetical protein Poli38472_010063 [Pythium oligandrum]